MYRIKIILMLSAIIPSLDCCCSRTLFNKKPNNLYPQYQQNELQLETALPSHDDQTTLSYRHHHLQYDNGEESDEDDKNIKLNRSQSSDLQIEEAHIEQKLKENFTPPASNDSKMSIDMNTTTDVQEEDAQLKLMGEIFSIECVEWFRLEFCLNGGRCFLYPIFNQSLSSCECAEGYVGERCEAKSFEFIPRIRPPVVLAKAIGGPLIFGLAVIDILFLIFLYCKNYNRN